MEWETHRYAHLPGVRLERDTVPVAGGEVRYVPFEEWAPFVGRHVERSERQYRAGQPVFYVDRLTIDDEGENGQGLEVEADLLMPFREVVSRVYAALMHVLRVSLPNPLHSTRYVLVPESKQRFRDPGSRDIEWMVYGATAEPVTLGDRAGVDLARAVTSLQSLGYGSETPQLQRIFDTFELASAPGLKAVDVVLHTVIVIEDVLNPDGKRPLADVFARRGALLVTDDHQAVSGLEGLLKDIYRIRSRAVHGKDPTAVFEMVQAHGVDPVRLVHSLGHSVTDALAACTGRQASDPAQLLRDTLDAATDQASYEEMRDVMPWKWLTR
jgi:hypothetical protein